MNCPRCRLKSKPFQENCAFCAAALRSEEEAELGRKEWDAMEARLRTDLEAKHEEHLERLRNRKVWIKDHRIRHAIAGAVLFGVPMIGLGRFQPLEPADQMTNVGWSFLVVLAGGALGFFLSTIRAGNLMGIIFFFVAFILMNLVAMLMGLGLNPAVLMFGMVLLLVAGAGMGMHLSNEDVDG